MDKISKKPFVAASYLTCDFSATSLGSVVTALVESNERQLAKEMPSLQLIGSGVAATLNLIADAVTCGDEVNRTRLAESLQLMASLSQFCADATEAVVDADFRENGGCMSLIRKIIFRLLAASADVRTEEEKPLLLIPVPTVWREVA